MNAGCFKTDKNNRQYNNLLYYSVIIRMWNLTQMEMINDQSRKGKSLFNELYNLIFTP